MSSFSTTTLDSNGTACLLDDHVVDTRFCDVSASTFANPNSTFTGYAADGYFYTNGEPDPVHDPFKASWASEGEGGGDENRGTVDRFPSRIFIVTTASEVVLLDADSLDVWMRFILGGTGLGYALGVTGTEIRGADFHNGVLAIATDAGVRIADFRTDCCYALGAAASYRSSVNLVDSRNTDGQLTTRIDVMDERLVVSAEVLCVSAGTGALDAVSPPVSGVLVALGHDSGVTVVQVPALDSDGVLQDLATKQHPFRQEAGGSWRAFEDNDGDGTTPYVYDDAGDAQLQWVNAGVRPGDVLVLDDDSEHTILSIDAARDVLEVTPEVDTTATGNAYTIRRPVPALVVRAGDRLVFANGHQKVYLADDGAVWYSATHGTVLDPWMSTSDSAVLSLAVSEIRDLAFSGDDVYIATDIGVFRVLGEALNSSGEASAELVYAGAASSSSPTYTILEGGSNCTAVAVDPETGHLFVATVDGGAGTVTEIDLAINQAFRYESYDNEVNVLFAYRNPEGPPDRDVT